MAERLCEGKVLCVVQGVSEVGPRALGHRSIIAHAGNPVIRDLINERKGRELWRPLAPLVRVEDFDRFFYGNAHSSRWMLFTFPVLSAALPAATHVDGSARAQAIGPGNVLYDVLTEIERLGQPPVLINISFNVAGEPIVETTEHAVRSFLKLGFDAIYLEGEIYQPYQGT